MSATDTPAAGARGSTNSFRPNNRTTVRRWFARIAGTTVITLLSLYTALPFALKFGVTHVLSEQSGRPVALGQLVLNPFNGKLFITQLRYLDNSPTTPDLAVGYASVQLDLTALFDKHLSIEEIVISNVDLGVQRDKNTTTIAGFTLPPAASASGMPDGSSTAPPTDWRVALHAVTVDDFRINYATPELSSRPKIERLSLGSIEPDNGDSVTPIQLALRLDRGQIDFDGQLELFGETPIINGSLKITQLDYAPYAAPFVPPHLKHIAGLLSFESRLNAVLPADNEPQISLFGDGKIEQFSLASKTHPKSYLNSGTIAFNGLDLRLPQQIVLNELRLEGLDLSVARDGQGKTGLTAERNEASGDVTNNTTRADVPPSDIAQPTETTTPRWIVNSIVIDESSQIVFSDATVTPHFDISLNPFQLTIGQMDSKQATIQTPLKVAATIDESATLAINGTVTPFTDPFATDLHATVTGLELPTLSPYTETYIGYELRRGRFATDTKVVIRERQLDITNHLKLTKLSLRESDREKAQGLIDELEMPLDSALDLLRDGDGNIIFDLPVKGSLDDPQFKLGGVMKFAIGRGMKMAAMNYLTNALQPLGTALLVKRVVGEITKPRFKPLMFAAGSAELDPQAQESLDGIGNLLSARPQLSITVCGIAMQNDHVALSSEKEATEQEVHALAAARAANTRDYLSSNQEIKTKQLFECNPEVSPKTSEAENQTVAGVEISL